MAEEVTWEIVPPTKEKPPTTGWEVLEGGIPRISAIEPPAAREQVTVKESAVLGGFGLTREQPESEPVYKQRLAQQYGISLEAGERHELMRPEIEKLPAYLDLTKGTPEDMKRIVDKRLAGRGELVFHEGYGDYVVRLSDGELVPFNVPGATLEEFRAPARQLAGEAIGGIIGVPGGPVGIGIGAAAGAGLTKIDHLTTGKEFGFHDMSSGDILVEGAIDAALALGAEFTFGMGGFIIRRMAGSPAAKKFLGEMTESQIDDAIKKFEQKAGEIEARTGVRPEATTGQVLAGVDPETGRAIQAFERGLEVTGEEVGAVARRTQLEAEQALQAQMFAGPPAEDITRAVPVGEAIQEVAERQILGRKETIAQDILDEQAEAITRQLDIVDVPPTAQTADEIRNYLIQARSDVLGPEGQLDRQYSQFWERVPELGVDMSGIRKVGKKWQRLLNSDIFKTLSKENRSIVEDALQAGVVKKREGELGIGLARETASLSQTTRALSLLKAEQRILSKAPAAAKTREMAVLNDLVSEMQISRDKALAKLDPEIRDQIYVLDETYRVAKEKIDESLVNRLITKRPGGGMRISDDKVMDAILRNPAEARNISGLMKSPDYAGFGLTDTFKDGGLGVYRDKVIDGAMTHKSFMNQYKGSLKEIFTPAEMRKFDSLNKATNAIKLAERREKSLLDQVNQSFEMKLTGYDPERILDEVAGSPSKTKKLMTMLKNEPDKLADYKSLRARKLLNDLESTDDLGNATIDFTKIGQILKKDKGELKELYGDQFVKDMGLLKDITKLRLVPKQIQTQMTNLLKETPPATAPVLFWRSTIARPLSRMGLLTTGALKIDRGAARKATAKLLRDPKAMQDAMNLYRKNAPLQKWKSLLTDIGAIELVRHLNEVEE